MVDGLLRTGFFHSFADKHSHACSLRLKADIRTFLPYGSPLCLLTVDLYNAVWYLSLISILSSKQWKDVTFKVVSIFRCWDVGDIYEKGASTPGLGYKIFNLNTDISLEVRDSLNNWFPPHLSVYTD